MTHFSVRADDAIETAEEVLMRSVDSMLKVRALVFIARLFKIWWGEGLNSAAASAFVHPQRHPLLPRPQARQHYVRPPPPPVPHPPPSGLESSDNTFSSDLAAASEMLERYRGRVVDPKLRAPTARFASLRKALRCLLIALPDEALRADAIPYLFALGRYFAVSCLHKKITGEPEAVPPPLPPFSPPPLGAV
jgi:hypothetical protein